MMDCDGGGLQFTVQVRGERRAIISVDETRIIRSPGQYVPFSTLHTADTPQDLSRHQVKHALASAHCLLNNAPSPDCRDRPGCVLEGPGLIRDNKEDMMDQLFGTQLRQSLSTDCISIDRQLGDLCCLVRVLRVA